MVEKLILKNKYIFLFIFFIIILKLVILFLFKYYDYDFFGSSSDADYYHEYAIAIGLVAEDTLFWPIILRYLNNIELYDRVYLSLFLSILAIFFIPYLVGKIAVVNNFEHKQKIILFLFFITSIIPTIFYFSLDIFRDIFMISIFLVGLFIIKTMNVSKNILKKTIYLFFLLFIAYLLFLFRPYLGFSFLIALLIYKFYSFKKYQLFLSIILFFLILQMAVIFGFVDSIIKYRTGFETVDGGSNLGINFDSATFFIPRFIQSFLYQMFGLYFTSIASIIAFCIETIPFLIALVYLVKNRKYSDKIVDFLIIFFVVYATIWVIGNDNLGTAVRLRVFNYLVIYIACFVVYQNKYILKRKVI